MVVSIDELTEAMNDSLIIHTTSNRGKLGELTHPNVSYEGYDVCYVKMPDIPEVQSSDVEEVAKNKLLLAVDYFDFSNYGDTIDRYNHAYLVVEDTALDVSIPDNKSLEIPGTFIKFIHDGMGSKGFVACVNALWELSAYKSERECTNDGVMSVCLCAYDLSTNRKYMGTHSLHGKIPSEVMDGPYGFGFDNIFCPFGQNRSMAQMTTEEKLEFSPRTAAVNLLLTNIREGSTI